MGTSEFEKISEWRFWWDWGISALAVVLMIFLCERVSFYFYPLTLFVIGHCYYRISVLGHEGAHYLLSRHRGLNLFLGTYFCHFAVFVSHARYKNIHSLHHRYTGLPQDPDGYLYRKYPLPMKKWGRQVLLDLLTFRIFFDFINYFTDLVDVFRPRSHRLPLKYVPSDFLQFCFYWGIVFLLISMSGQWKGFLLYWFLPIYMVMPVVQLSNALQHGGYGETIESRTLLSHGSSFLEKSLSRFFVTWLAPLDLNYHFEHHHSPYVPHYNLARYAEYLKTQNETGQLSNSFDLHQTARALFGKTQDQG